MWWNACVHRLDIGLCSHPKEFGGGGGGGGMEPEPMLTQRKHHLYWKTSQRRIKPMTLHQAGQQAQHTTNELVQPLTAAIDNTEMISFVDGSVTP